MSTFSAGPLVADEADLIQVHSVALTQKWRSGRGLGWMEWRRPWSFSSVVFLPELHDGRFQSYWRPCRQSGASRRALQPQWSTGWGLCGRTWGTSLGSPWTFSLGLLCLCGQMRVRHTRRSLVGDGLPSLRHGRPSKVGISGKWLWCWWPRPVQEPRRWWRSRSSGWQRWWKRSRSLMWPR